MHLDDGHVRTTNVCMTWSNAKGPETESVTKWKIPYVNIFSVWLDGIFENFEGIEGDQKRTTWTRSGKNRSMLKIELKLRVMRKGTEANVESIIWIWRVNLTPRARDYTECVEKRSFEFLSSGIQRRVLLFSNYTHFVRKTRTRFFVSKASELVLTCREWSWGLFILQISIRVQIVAHRIQLKK